MRSVADMLILALILFGIVAGGVAQLILGRSMKDIDWTTAVVTGLLDSFVGGLGLSLATGNGLDLHATGLIGSIFGALPLTWAWGFWRRSREG
ncbi:GlsB/YeaQ/YmgE family stress response membrane protein [Nocardioides panzhihuensis]|uniref:Putative membrane protein YeaQ/YmgE (Transglycosylase-associated protein family) n=1 Tax=Nocardioides panzhihuensis TaxID=860243 RepID=A0A7Z0DPA7_9ACTN|nr:GlsB/YeaQ/YmgE family stress response membrane protein [Nocardioides panzhihuensis]NYI79285.1 putative membrane protein YeaQ/YmgE (transglycosylase-associated protein family) [Nocardioides panzhihuensis]